MPQLKRIFDSPRQPSLRGLGTRPILLASLLCFPSMAQQPGQKTYGTAEEAGLALVKAAQRNDEKALLEILGPDGKQIVSSGDESEDASDRANFVEKYQEMHRLVKEPDGTTTLYIGAKNWPTPIPLVDMGGSWFFDTNAGKQEILCRRVGQNETSAIHLCRDLVAAQREYFTLQQNQYAKVIFSDEGKRNGLYWKAAAGEPQSPLGPLVAADLAKGFSNQQKGLPTPHHGYYFRILTHQGKHAPGGTKSYLVNGKMTKGFALLAYPMEYRSSGVMTFIVFQNGAVLQKDLGRKTVALAKTMSAYNPSPDWLTAENRPEDVASR